MDDEATQPSTQQFIDPRRLGGSILGLDEADIADILCILTPTSPAAFQIVTRTAEFAPQHVLRSHPVNGYQPDTQPFSQSLQEAETFILNDSGAAHDIALRFSSSTKQPPLGFCFGRNTTMCDVLLTAADDSSKRISNLHFRIYVNHHGVLMLEDRSTNGTMVDDVHLRAKGKDANAQKTMMLRHGSTVNLLSPKPEEHIKFIVRLPDQTGYEEQYTRNLDAYLERVESKRQAQNDFAVPTAPKRAQNTGVRRPPVSAVQTFGMHWNGGREYNVVDLLGKGAFATVYKIATAMDGHLLAAKELEKKRFMKNGQVDQKLDNEMKIMQSLSHPHIVQYIETKDIGNHLYIIMEYVPYGNLSEWLNNNHVLPEHAAKRMACQIFSSLAYLHSKRITHRDIKPDNILISSEDPFDVKLSDFGLSKVVSNNETFLKTFCGTLLYCAPEVFPHYDGNGNKKRRKPGQSRKSFHSYSQSVDIWSFGAVIWFALCGSPPFEGIMDNTGRAMFNRIMETPLDPTPLREANVSELAIDLLLAMLNTDPAARPTELQCLSHPWLSELAKEIVPYAVQPDLKAIPEEEEEDEEDEFGADAENQFSQLSLSDRKAGYGVPDYFSDEEEDEYGEELQPINPHQSKRPRVRRDPLPPRYQPRNMSQFESSPEESQNPAPRTRNGVDSFAIPGVGAGVKNRLFGEIGQSALRNPRALGSKTNQALSMEEDSSGPDVPEKSPKANQSIKRRSKTPIESQTTPRKDPRGNKAAASLYGAESMVRDLTMHSPNSPSSPYDQDSEPKTPVTPTRSIPETPSPNEKSVNNVGNAVSQHSEEQTPRPQTTSFHRQIKLRRSASYYWDPSDPSTHTLQYASMVSGIEFTSRESVKTPELRSMPSTNCPSEAIEDYTDEEDTKDAAIDDGGAVHSPPSDPAFRVPAPRLGKLTSTDDSALKLVLRLEKQVESWGRLPSNTIMYADANDFRVPRNAFTLWFYSPSMDEMAREGKDWTKDPNVCVFIHTNSSKGILVNKTELGPPQANGVYPYGFLHTGDIITVDYGKNGFIKFVCEFSVGLAARPRPEGQEFKIYQSRTPEK